MAKLIDPPSAQSFPLISRLLRLTTADTTTSTTSTSASSRKTPPPFLPRFPASHALVQTLLALACFVAAVYTDFALLAAVLRVLSPGLPGACVCAYVLLFGVLMVVGRCEGAEEERWRERDGDVR